MPTIYKNSSNKPNCDDNKCKLQVIVHDLSSCESDDTCSSSSKTCSVNTSDCCGCTTSSSSSSKSCDITTDSSSS